MTEANDDTRRDPRPDGPASGVPNSVPAGIVPGPGEPAERIALQRATAVISHGSIAVRAARAGLIGPLIEGLLAAAAVWAIVSFIDRLPVWVLMLLLLAAIVLGPIAILGVVYNILGTSFLMEREKQSARWQQGLFGLGLGSYELVPFWRIQRIEVTGNFEDELGSGELQDLVQWDVQLVKDNDRVLEVGSVVSARSLADLGLDRANTLAAALAEMAGAPARLGELPEGWDDDEWDDEAFGDEEEGDGIGNDTGNRAPDGAASETAPATLDGDGTAADDDRAAARRPGRRT